MDHKDRELIASNLANLCRITDYNEELEQGLIQRNIFSKSMFERLKVKQSWNKFEQIGRSYTTLWVDSRTFFEERHGFQSRLSSWTVIRCSSKNSFSVQSRDRVSQLACTIELVLDGRPLHPIPGQPTLISGPSHLLEYPDQDISLTDFSNSRLSKRG